MHARARTVPTGGATLAAAYAALVVFGVHLRVPGLDPPSFGDADAWLAIAIRDMTWQEFLAIRPTVPIGFRFVQSLFGWLSADPEWPLQIVPIGASLALAVLAGVLAARVCRDRWAGPVATAWTLVSPTWVELGVRPKQYATDGLVTVVLVLLAVRLHDEPTRARARWLLGAAVAGLALSFPAAFVIAPAFVLAVLRPETRAALLGRGNRAVVASSAGALGGLLLFMRGQASEGLWSWMLARPESYMPTDSITAAASFVVECTGRFLSSAFPEPLAFLAFGVAGGLLARRRERARRALSLLVAGIFVALLVASAVQLYPVLPPRLWAFHRPLPPVLLAIAVHDIARMTASRWPRAHYRWVLLLVTLAALPFAERSAYPPAQHAQAARAVSEVLRPGDTVIAVRAAHALGYYSPEPRKIVRTTSLAVGFLAQLSRPNVHHFLLGSPHDPRAWQNLEDQLERALATATERIVFVQPQFGYERARPTVERMLSRIEQDGYRPVRDDPETSAYFVVLERDPR